MLDNPRSLIAHSSASSGNAIGRLAGPATLVGYLMRLEFSKTLTRPLWYHTPDAMSTESFRSENGHDCGRQRDRPRGAAENASCSAQWAVRVESCPTGIMFPSSTSSQWHLGNRLWIRVSAHQASSCLQVRNTILMIQLEDGDNRELRGAWAFRCNYFRSATHRHTM